MFIAKNEYHIGKSNSSYFQTSFNTVAPHCQNQNATLIPMRKPVKYALILSSQQYINIPLYWHWTWTNVFWSVLQFYSRWTKLVISFIESLDWSCKMCNWRDCTPTKWYQLGKKVSKCSTTMKKNIPKCNLRNCRMDLLRSINLNKKTCLEDLTSPGKS